jgi:hexosaminidase
MNILHIKFTGSFSFPIQTSNYKKLYENGRFKEGLSYSKDDLAQIKRMGYERGIKIITEFDYPRRAGSILFSYPELIAKCPIITETNRKLISLNPLNDGGYTLIETVLKELIDYKIIKNGDHLHIGNGNEFNFDCWREDKNISQYLTEKGLSFDDLQVMFIKKYESILQKYNLNNICYEDLYMFSLNRNDYKLSGNYTIQIYDNPNNIQKGLNDGYKVISSFGWVIDKISSNSFQYNFHDLGDIWKLFYNIEPYDFITSKHENFLGGEALLFGDQVDQFNIDYKLWPGLISISERFWYNLSYLTKRSNKNINNLESAKERFNYYRCNTLLKRNVNLGPFEISFCQYAYRSKPNVNDFNFYFYYSSLFTLDFVLFLCILFLTFILSVFVYKYIKVSQAIKNDKLINK